MTALPTDFVPWTISGTSLRQDLTVLEVFENVTRGKRYSITEPGNTGHLIAPLMV
jgi:hypothetical protein